MITEALQNWAQKAADVLCNLRSHAAPATPAPGIVAHRGAWDRDHVENTMAAFQRAKNLGAWAVEFDVHFTKDGVPVIHHDKDLRRCHKHDGILRDLTYSELQKAAPNVPSLEQLLSEAGLHFMIEIKVAMGQEQEQALSRVLSRFRPLEHYHLLTLEPGLIRTSSALPNEAWILVGDVNMNSLTRFSLARKMGGVAGHYLFMTNRIVKQLHGAGQKAGVGFPPTRNLYQREWNRGVDWVFTNHLAALTQEM